MRNNAVRTDAEPEGVPWEEIIQYITRNYKYSREELLDTPIIQLELDFVWGKYEDEYNNYLRQMTSPL